MNNICIHRQILTLNQLTHTYVGLISTPSIESLNSDRPRPLLLIFDRTADMAPPLLHTSTYQALIDDLLDHHLNRVTIELPAKDGK